MKNQNREKYAYLEQLTTRQLEELLLADLDDDSGRDTSEVVFHILEVLREREKDPAQEPDVDQAWERFQTYYNTPEGEGQALYPCVQDRLNALQEKDSPDAKSVHLRFRYSRRGFSLVAATIALLFVLMIGVQASGHDIFGALAQWTSEIFHFGSGHGQYYEMFLEELRKNDIPENFIPTRFPNKFEASEPKVLSDDFGTFLQLPFYDETGKTFSITLEHYNSSEDIESWIFEKDLALVESYAKGDMVFYILSNVESTTATWVHGTFSETIWGNLSIEEIKLIIDSIGGL
ncbi:MAG: DUF4367 domain-containing protein [Oscillospiraceae bacterium]|nr:DUF4367 domain-containing protein [Oscillospiraceae bacterium]